MADLCIDARMAFSSGIGTYIREIVPFLQNSPFRTILLVDEIGRPWAEGFDQIRFNAPIYSIQEQYLYPAKIPSCSLFWSPHYNIPVFPIRAKKRIATLHDACHLAFGSFAQRSYGKWAMKKALKKSDRAITVSQFSKQEIEGRLGMGNLEVVPIGVNPDRFQKKPFSKRVQTKYGLPSRFVLFLGNQKPHKNLEMLKKAFLRVGIPDLELVLIGKGTERGEADEEDLPFLYSMAEAFVFPSLYEGFGLPPLEAMSCGCPTVVSKSASIPEVCRNGSLYFDPNDEEEMGAAIRKVAETPSLKKELIEKGAERVRQFDWKKTAERHLQIFDEALYA